jgi:S-adenosylmethionine hydrolase
VDRFGNLITNIDRVALGTLSAGFDVEIDGRVVSHVVATYAEAPMRSVCALVGSSGRLEIAVNAGDAASVLAAGRGARVRVSTPA